MISLLHYRHLEASAVIVNKCFKKASDKCIVVKPSLCENGPNFPRHFGLKLGMVFGRISGDVPYGSFDFSLKILV